MYPQINTDFCVIDRAGPTETDKQWKIVNYGEMSPTPESSAFLQARKMVASAATPFEFTDLFSKGNISFITSGTSSNRNVQISDTPWFINDKIHRVIVFPHRERLPGETTWACCIHADLPQISATAHFVQAFQRIGRFVKFTENWDSYGAKVINKNCIIRGVVILKELINLRFATRFEIPVPFIAPLSSGGIQMEWEKDERYLEISITSDPPTADYFAADKAKEGQLTLEGSLRSASALKELLTWFVNGTAEDLAHLSFEEAHEEWAF